MGCHDDVWLYKSVAGYSAAVLFLPTLHTFSFFSFLSFPSWIPSEEMDISVSVSEPLLEVLADLKTMKRVHGTHT